MSRRRVPPSSSDPRETDRTRPGKIIPMGARRRIRGLFALICCAVALALLVAGTVPRTRFLEVPTPETWPFGVGAVRCCLVVSWESGPGGWAGQTNDLG